MNIEIEKKKKEALERMRALRIFPQTIKQFEKLGHISISEPPFGAFYWAEGEDLEHIRQFEERYNALVYVVIRSYTSDGKTDSYLFVSDHEDEWPTEREDIKNKEVLAYVYSHDAPQFSEIGYIGIAPTVAAGLKQVW